MFLSFIVYFYNPSSSVEDRCVVDGDPSHAPEVEMTGDTWLHHCLQGEIRVDMVPVLFLSSHWASPVMDHRAGEAANSSL